MAVMTSTRNEATVVMATARLRPKRAVRERTSAEHQHLAEQVALMRPDNLDPDMLEERARIMLNYVRPDELVIIDGAGGH